MEIKELKERIISEINNEYKKMCLKKFYSFSIKIKMEIL
jgi:hypothetical protein